MGFMSIESDRDCFTLSVPSQPESLSVVRSVVESLSKLAGHDDQTRYEVVLAVHEACSNVILHSHDGRCELPIKLEFRLASEGLEIRLRDEGSYFDLAAIPDLDPTELRRGGRGIYLIRRYMDEVTSTVRPQGGNELRMFRRTEAASV